jgi:hypothetical protein
MADGGSIAVRFGFDPGSYQAVRLAGLSAYAELADALRELYLEGPAPGSASQETGASQDSLERGKRAVVDRLPPPSDDLPLRSLVRLAHCVRSGELQHWYSEPPGPSGRPVSAGLRQWRAQYEDEFTRFFPEQLAGGELPDLVQWHHRTGEAMWAQTGFTSIALARSLRIPEAAPVALYALLRDYAVELQPLLSDRRDDYGALVQGALDHLEDDAPNLDVAEAWLQRTRNEHGLGESPAAALLAFLEHGSFPWARELATAFDGRDLVEQARKWDEGRASDGKDGEPGEFAVQNRAVSDLPAQVDSLGVLPLVMGLQELLDDPDTTLPLAIGVTAPWGGGKSSLMCQLRDVLEAGGRRDWIPIRFDAWKYERSERLWAALGKAIYEQPQERWGWSRRLGFKVRLQWARSGGWRFWGQALALPLLLLVAAGALAIVAPEALLTAVLGLGAVAAVLNSALRVSGLVGHPFKRALDRYTRRPRYDDELGFTSEADADIACLAKVLTREEGVSLAVFVDDLDRCSPAHVVEVIEAINQIFNSAESRPCLFVIGMDRDVVAASIEVAYQDTIARLEAGRGENFGHEFLAKVVQLSVAIPPPRPDDLRRLLRGLRGDDNDSSPVSVDSVMEATFEALGADGGRDAVRPAEVEAEVRRLEEDYGTAEQFEQRIDEVVRARRAQLLNRDSAEVAEAEEFIVPFLQPNPREVKRFDNAFRLQLHVANRSPDCELSFDLDDLIALGKWVALRLRWPDLAAQLDLHPELLGEMEEACNNPLAGRSATAEEWLAKREIQSLLTEKDPARRIARLDSHTFLRVS